MNAATFALARRIRDARADEGMSQQEVADKLGVLRPSVSLMESGARKVSALELAALASIFRRTTDHFLRGLGQ